jgi:HEAT repeat protein
MLMTKPEDLPPCPPEYTPEEWAEYHRDPCGWCIKELRNPDADIRCNAADILRGLAWDAVGAIPALIEGCRDADKQVRAYCVHALVDIGHAVHRRVPAALPSLAAAVPALIAALCDDFGEVRSLAVHALGAVGQAAAPAAAQLQGLLATADEETREAVVRALKRIGVSD